MDGLDIGRIGRTLKSVLSANVVNEAGRISGLSKRLRVVTPFKLLLALITSFASGIVESIADLLREFNFQNNTSTAYKAFYNRLANSGFAPFMREMVCCLLTSLAMRMLEPEPDSPCTLFDDIVIQDGTSFAVKNTLQAVFKGRFTAIEPAAVELHVTYSGYEDQVTTITLAPDKEAERAFLPKPKELTNKLLLADRGYPSVKYFKALDRENGSFIIRLTRSWKPFVLAVYQRGRMKMLHRPIRLNEFLSQNQNKPCDLDVAFSRGERQVIFRLAVLPGKDHWMTRLCTNLPRDRFPLDLIGRLYRFRWQVELCFKEWKSYANLHKFDTSNPDIAEGLIWASLAAAIVKRFLAHAAQVIGNGIAISTRKVAMCAKHFIGELLVALNHHKRCFLSVLANAIEFLLSNARRSHPQRDLLQGRQNIGLAICSNLT